MNAWTLFEKVGARTIWFQKIATTGGAELDSYAVTRDVNGESVKPGARGQEFGSLRSARLCAKETDEAWDRNGWDQGNGL